MALYKQGSHREEEHKEQGERKAGGSHDGSENTKRAAKSAAEPPRLRVCQQEGVFHFFFCNKEVFFLYYKAGEGVKFAGAFAVLRVTAYCKPM